MRIGRASIVILLVGVLATMLQGPAQASLSPDELAIVQTAADGHRVIFLVTEENVPVRPLVDLGNRDAIQPSWSPDGRTLLFSAQAEPGGPFAVYTSDPDTLNGTLTRFSDPVGATGPSEGDFSPSWSPDGAVIAFARAIAGASAIHFQLVGGSTAIPLTDLPWDPYQVEPTWVPDSTAVVFANRDFAPGSDPAEDPDHPGFHFQLVRVPLNTGFPEYITGEWSVDFHTPDVSPNGSRVAAAATFDVADPPPTLGAFVSLTGPRSVVYDAFTGSRNPDFSPDGAKIVADFDPDISFITHLAGSGGGGVSGVDASWRPPEHAAPRITFDVPTDAQGWLDGPVTVTAIDDDSPIFLMTCELDGTPLQLSPAGNTDPNGATGKLFLDGIEGEPTLSCTAVDIIGNAGSASVNLRVDFLAPRLGTPSIGSPRPVGHGIDVSATYQEEASGLTYATLTLQSSDGRAAAATMTPSNGTILGSLAVPVGVWDVVVGARDARGNWGGTRVPEGAIVFDPAGSSSGTGWIVPGGGTSDLGDTLPGLDGRTKASFSLSAKYRGTAIAPSGSFNLNVGSRFKIQSTALAWLVVEGSVATLQGSATIRGIGGEFTFRVIARDGGRHGDHLVVRAWPAGTAPASASPTYQASGDVSGQIQVAS